MPKTLLSLLLWSLITTLYSTTFAQTACTMQYDPVCGTDGMTYGNACTASAANKTIASAGECKTWSELDQALKFAYQFGITKYNNLTNFKSETLVTREQVSKMMLQFAKAMSRTNAKSTFDCAFTDLNITDPTLTNYITDACNQGMIKWWANAFHPQNTVTQAQAITMLMRVVDGIKIEPEQRWTPYEQYAISQWYIKQALGQPKGMITRWELITLMNTIYSKTNQSNTIYETWTIQDTLVPCQWETTQKCMQISRNNKPIELFYDQIQWFNYVAWYTYTLQVIGSKITNPAADSSNMSRSLVSVISHASTNGKPDILPQPWCDRFKIDNTTLSVRWQTCTTDAGLVTVSYDKTLPWVIISSKQAQITTQIPVIHLFISSATWLQSLLFNTHSTMIKQWIVNKSAACIFKQNASIIGSKIDRFDFISNGTGDIDCGLYEYNNSSASYFIKPKGIFTTMIYINNNEQRRKYIDRSTLDIK